MNWEAAAELLRVALMEGWEVRKKTSLRNCIPRGDRQLAANARAHPTAATSTASPNTPLRDGFVVRSMNSDCSDTGVEELHGYMGREILNM